MNAERHGCVESVFSSSYLAAASRHLLGVYDHCSVSFFLKKMAALGRLKILLFFSCVLIWNYDPHTGNNQSPLVCLLVCVARFFSFFPVIFLVSFPVNSGVSRRELEQARRERGPPPASRVALKNIPDVKVITHRLIRPNPQMSWFHNMHATTQQWKTRKCGMDWYQVTLLLVILLLI